MTLSRRLLHREDGMSLIETMIAGTLSLVVLGTLSAALVAGLKTTQFGSNETVSLDSAREVLNQIERDVQGSTGLELCLPSSSQPAGSCTTITVQPPTGTEQSVRYRVTGSSLYRETYVKATGVTINSRLLTTHLANYTQTPASQAFTCSTNLSLVQFGINLKVQPNPSRTDTYNLQTLVRPRHVFQAGC